MNKAIFLIFIVILRLVAVALYKSAELSSKPFDYGLIKKKYIEIRSKPWINVFTNSSILAQNT